MKALIVIEIPDDHFLITANDLYERLKGYKCELKPLPELKDEFKVDTKVILENKSYADGWNECLEEITGESE